LRLRVGDRVEALDGHGSKAIARLAMRGTQLTLEFVEAGDAATMPAASTIMPLELEMTVLKGDAMEWVIEKAVELGVRRLVPVLTQHTVVQLKNKGPEAFQERWQRIADQALKQCGRLERLDVALPTPLETLAGDGSLTRLWCDEVADSPYLMDWIGAQSPAPQALRLLIGPEGGWSEVERELLNRSTGVVRVGLGSLILRAETAAIFGASLLAGSFHSRQWPVINN
jgi:16S rRNA (uracil1498-N3)-methyltransferase